MKPSFLFSTLKPFSFTSENVERELQRCLANIEEVEDYVKIFKTNITSTEILPNLRTIHGKNLVYNKWVKADSSITHVASADNNIPRREATMVILFPDIKIKRGKKKNKKYGVNKVAYSQPYQNQRPWIRLKLKDTYEDKSMCSFRYVKVNSLRFPKDDTNLSTSWLCQAYSDPKIVSCIQCYFGLSLQLRRTVIVSSIDFA